MELKIERFQTTRLYTMGLFFINGKQTSHTVEDTLTMLEPGTYRIRLQKGHARRREIVILTNNRTGNLVQHAHCLDAGVSYLFCRINKSIGLGEFLIPGCVLKGGEYYERLFDRLEKAEERKESILLTITDKDMSHNEPVDFWCTPSHHYNPPTQRRVELNEDYSVDIYEGDVHCRHLTVEDQRKLREA